MRIDWDGMLQPKPAPVVADSNPAPDTGASDAAPVIDADIAAREREGDDRRRCVECGNLGERGVCLAAQRREFVASRGYTPIRDILRRCEGFTPLPSDPDQRHGRTKWACLLYPSGRSGAPS